MKKSSPRHAPSRALKFNFRNPITFCALVLLTVSLVAMAHDHEVCTFLLILCDTLVGRRLIQKKCHILLFLFLDLDKHCQEEY